ncbi:MAG: hypothetical protein HFE78_07380 [Clostridiales bacterium]|nr:hypothetical protein [Clostridiales bacterium]
MVQTSKSILISIQPKWSELIASGKKTIEVRKTRPRIEPPFKCYIYQTQCEPNVKYGYQEWARSGKVIGEFVCDRINKFTPTDKGIRFNRFSDLGDTGLSLNEILRYSKGKTVYGWNISDLVIYDKPRELGEFYSLCPEWERRRFTKKCHKCPYYSRNDYDMCYECGYEGEKPLTRPPMSWCYVEEFR